MTTIYQYPSCSTCKKALRWLDDHGIAYEAVNIATNPPAIDVLRKLWSASGLPLKRFFNTSGQSYRNGGFSERLKTMSDDEALAALAADGMLIKRPILQHGETVLVGFKDEDWTAALAESAS